MKNLKFALGIVLFVLMGCATQTHFLSKESKLSVFKKINHNHKKTGKITTTGGVSFAGKNIFIASDSIFWVVPETTMKHSMATLRIEEIEFSSGGQYIAAGAGIGLVAGGTFGFIIGIVEDSKRVTLDPFSTNPDPGSGIRKNTIIGASIGMGVGILAGIGKSTNEKFVLDYPRRRRKLE